MSNMNTFTIALALAILVASSTAAPAQVDTGAVISAARKAAKENMPERHNALQDVDPMVMANAAFEGTVCLYKKNPDF